MPKLLLRNENLSRQEFFDAFDKLCKDPLPVQDRFRLAETRRDLKSAADVYREQHLELVKRHGVPQLDLLNRRIDEATIANQGNAPATLRLIAQRDQLVTRKIESFTVDDRDKAKLEAFGADIKAMHELTFPTHLERKIPLTDSSLLDARDIELLFDLVELKPE